MCSNRRREGGREGDREGDFICAKTEGEESFLKGTMEGEREIERRRKKEIAKESRQSFVCLSVSCESSKWRRRRGGGKNKTKSARKKTKQKKRSTLSREKKGKARWALSSDRLLLVAIGLAFTRQESPFSCPPLPLLLLLWA